MRISLSVVHAFLFFPLLIGCSAAQESKTSAEQANLMVDQAKREASDPSGKTGTDILAKVKDETAMGGQPGRISISGSLVASDGTLVAQVQAVEKTGVGWRGQPAALNQNNISLSSSVLPKSATEIEKLSQNQTYIQLGCSSDLVARFSSRFREIQPVINAVTMTRELVASAVLICDQKLVGSVLIRAPTVILYGARLSLEGILTSTIQIEADALVLEGENDISTSAPDGLTTLLAGPSVSITAGQIKGAGKLEISTEGSSYLENGRP